MPTRRPPRRTVERSCARTAAAAGMPLAAAAVLRYPARPRRGSSERAPHLHGHSPNRPVPLGVSHEGAPMSEQITALPGRPAPQVLDSDIPARLDRLPWTCFHWLLVTALGITWVLDGLEVTIVSAVGNALLSENTLHLREGQLGLSHTLYLFGRSGAPSCSAT